MPAADWGQVVDSFQRGAEFTQRYRANKQREQANDLILKEMGREGFDKDQSGLSTAADIQDLYGRDTPLYQHESLPDPLAFMIGRKIKSWFGKKGEKGAKKKQAIELGGDEFEPSNPGIEGDEEAPVAMGEESDEYGYADGGAVSEEEKIRERAARNRANNPGRVSSSTEAVYGADRTAKTSRPPGKLDSMRRAINFENPPNASRAGKFVRGAGRLAAKAGATAALVAPIANQMDERADERYARRFGWDGPSEDQGDASFGGFLKYFGKRMLGYASDVGDFATMGLAGELYSDDPHAEEDTPSQAIPVKPQSEAKKGTMGSPMQLSTMEVRVRRPALPQDSKIPDDAMANFGEIEMEAKDVPNVTTDDWKKYRIAAMQHAARIGMDPATAHEYADDQITRMQMKGFLNYGQQGLVLQQAGNTRGAMAAYRAAFQYFPNGNDVEFGTSKNKRTGREQIIGFGKDEKTGKVVPGSELIMDPERVSTLLENFRNPQAFRMWTKDWRDFKEGQRRYEEVTKPLAQAQADSLANTSEARILAAENAALRAGGGGAGGAGGAANLRNAERVFRERLGMMGLKNEVQADMLASVMSQVKVANPGVPDNTIVQVIMAAARDGTLEQRLQRFGVSAPAPTPASPSSPARQALPTGGEYDERVMASTPAR